MLWKHTASTRDDEKFMTEAPLISVKEALERVLTVFTPLPSEQVALMQASGRVLAEDVIAQDDLPRFDNSSMDGFALHPADRPASPDQTVELEVVADIPAGTQPTLTLNPGQAARIMTGAPLPEGTDCVVPVEDTDFPYRTTQALPPHVKVYRFPPSGSNIRPRGQDAAKNEVLLPAGRLLHPAAVALLASLGYLSVAVTRRPRVGILSTGDELVSPGETLAPGQIYESNSIMLGGLVTQAGAIPQLLGVVADDHAAVEQKLTEALAARPDLILTSAGVSVGVYDYVRQVIEENGRLELWRVNMRPGKPFTFGHYKDIPIIGLPGNPVSAFTGFMVFVQPVIQRLLGHTETQPLRFKARLAHDIHSDGRESYLRAVVASQGEDFIVHLNSHQGSGNLLSIVRANALLIVPAGVKSLPAGAKVDVWLLTDTHGI